MRTTLSGSSAELRTKYPVNFSKTVVKGHRISEVNEILGHIWLAAGHTFE
jgi:hypothetical protein